MECFIKVALNIRNLNPEVALHHMVTTLRPRQFIVELCMTPTIDLDELRQRAAKLMQLKWLKDFINKLRVETMSIEKKIIRQRDNTQGRFST